MLAIKIRSGGDVLLTVLQTVRGGRKQNATPCNFFYSTFLGLPFKSASFYSFIFMMWMFLFAICCYHVIADLADHCDPNINTCILNLSDDALHLWVSIPKH